MKHLISASLAAAVIAGFPAAAAARPVVAGCADNYLIGSRGSGQYPAGEDGYAGLGPEVYQFGERLQADMATTGRSVWYLANSYPAVALSPGGANADNWMWNVVGIASKLPIGSYHTSVASGVSQVVDEVDALTRACPDTKIVLAGYSQGAQVTGDAYQRLDAAARAHVLGVFLLSDPRRNPADPTANFGTAAGGDGSVRESGLPAREAFPAAGGRVRSYCQAGDPVCEGPFRTTAHGLVINSDASKHLDYATRKNRCGTYPEQAADYFADLAGAPGRSTGPAVALTWNGMAEAGVPVRLSAGSSCDPAGEPLAFSWRVDGVPHPASGDDLRLAFRDDGRHTVQVTATNSQGETATATAVVNVTSPGAFGGVPRAPDHVASSARAGSAALTWDPPATGPSAEAYEVFTTSGEPLARTGPGQPRSVVIRAADLPLHVVVQAVNRVGAGGVSAPVTMSADARR